MTKQEARPQVQGEVQGLQPEPKAKDRQRCSFAS